MGTNDVTINITVVNQPTQETGAAADTVLSVFGELTEQSKNLRHKSVNSQTRPELIKRFHPEYGDAVQRLLELVKRFAV